MRKIFQDRLNVILLKLLDTVLVFSPVKRWRILSMRHWNCSTFGNWWASDFMFFKWRCSIFDFLARHLKSSSQHSRKYINGWPGPSFCRLLSSWCWPDWWLYGRWTINLRCILRSVTLIDPTRDPFIRPYLMLLRDYPSLLQYPQC